MSYLQNRLTRSIKQYPTKPVRAGQCAKMRDSLFDKLSSHRCVCTFVCKREHVVSELSLSLAFAAEEEINIDHSLLSDALV